MSILDAIIQGLVQGLTEFLPISSSGHLSIIQYFTGSGGESGAIFSVFLHMGTLIAVFIAFFPTIWALIVEFFRMIGDIFTGRFSFKKAGPERRMIFMLVVSLIPLALVVFLKDFYQSLSSDNDIIVEGICLLLTGLLLTLADRCTKGHRTAGDMRYKDALAIGAMQAIAPLPGLSRSGSTISMGLMMGLERQFAVAFSFIMGVPAVLGANLLEMKDAMSEGLAFQPTVLIIGLLVAAVSGFLAIKMVNWLVKSDKFKYFAYYTFVVGTLVVLLGIYETLTNHSIQRMLIG